MICTSKNIRVGDRFEVIRACGGGLVVGDVWVVRVTGRNDVCVNLRTLVETRGWNLRSTRYFKRVP